MARKEPNVRLRMKTSLVSRLKIKLAELHREADPSPFVEEIMESLLHGEIIRLSPDLRDRLISHFKRTLGRDFTAEQAVDWALTEFLRETDKATEGIVKAAGAEKVTKSHEQRKAS